jgi:hypothetical protein
MIHITTIYIYAECTCTIPYLINNNAENDLSIFYFNTKISVSDSTVLQITQFFTIAQCDILKA